VFSWLNNFYPGDMSDLKVSMEKLLGWLRDNY
jgi:hypothetical protein